MCDSVSTQPHTNTHKHIEKPIERNIELKALFHWRAFERLCCAVENKSPLRNTRKRVCVRVRVMINSCSMAEGSPADVPEVSVVPPVTTARRDRTALISSISNLGIQYNFQAIAIALKIMDNKSRSSTDPMSVSYTHLTLPTKA